MIIRRIAVAIDGSPHSLASIEAARDLALGMQAELQGIFVEDDNLFRLAGLPGSSEVRPYSSEARQIEPGELERAVRIQARKAEEALLSALGSTIIRHTFTTLRGLVPESVLEAALQSDLLVLGRTGRSPCCRRGLGSTAERAMLEGKKPLLLMQKGFSATKEPLLVLYDGSEGSEAALRAAMTLAPKGALLHVLILEEEPQAGERMEASLGERLAASGLEAEFHHLPLRDGTMLAQFIRMAESGLLVLSDDMRLPKEEVHRLVGELDYPVLLV